MTVAIAAWDLQAMSRGRFELGLGTQVKANIEKRYSAHWGSPVPQLREYMQSIKAIFHSFQTGERLCFEGEHYQFTKLQPFFNPGPIEHPDIPIYAGAVGPAMTKMVGRIADGMITHPTNTAPRYIKEVCIPRLRAGAEQAGRSLDEVELVLGPLCATGVDEQSVEAQWEKQRSLLSFLYSTPAYWPSLELFGWQDTGQQLLDMTRNGNWQDMQSILTDDILAEIVPRGSYKNIAAELKQRYQGLTDKISFPMPENPEHDGYAAETIAQVKSSD